MFTSPPFTNARTYANDRIYGIDAARDTEAWVRWMRPIVVEAARVSKGLAVFNVSDVVTDCVYGGGPEYLFADVTRLDGLKGIRPYAWVKSGPGFDDRGNGLPGSGGTHFHRNDWEPILGFAEPGKLPPHWSNNIAFGDPPRRPRLTPIRIKHTKRGPNGVQQSQKFKNPTISNPGNVIRVRVGGHRLGHTKTLDNEAPMPLGVAERFVCWFVPPGGRVCDPFVGMGTTAHAAVLHGREFIGCDLRQNQVEATIRRLSCVMADQSTTKPKK